jgi:hypothetical protein
MFFERIFKAFGKASLRYCVIGGIAVNLHGYNRLTADLDIVIAMNDGEITKFIKIVRKLGLIPRLPVKLDDFSNSEIRKEWINQRNMIAFSVYNPKDPLEHIDVKMDDAEKIENLLKNMVIMKAGSTNINVVSLDDLIKLKKEAGRGHDLIDLKALQKIKELT